MSDQAQKLRELVNKLNNKSKINSLDKFDKSTRIISITSGKGGVGKSNFTINLAISLSDLGYKVVVFDADIGFANIDVIAGVEPRFTIADVINGNKSIFDIIVDGPNGVKLISGGSGISEIMKLNNDTLELLTSQLLLLDGYADYILIDTSAGISDASVSFLNSSSEIILITTPEPTSLTDGYAMIKTLIKNNQDVSIKVVVNRVENYIQSYQVYDKLNKVTKRFLKTDLDNLGYVLDSKMVSDSVMKQRPFILEYPKSNISKNINSIALSLLGVSENKKVENMKNFIDNFKEFFIKRRK